MDKDNTIMNDRDKALDKTLDNAALIQLFKLPQEDDFDKFNDIDELAGEPAEPAEPAEILPPSRRPLVIDFLEEVPHRRTKTPLNKFIIGIGLWCQMSRISR